MDEFSISMYEVGVMWNHASTLEEEAMKSKEETLIGLIWKAVVEGKDDDRRKKINGDERVMLYSRTYNKWSIEGESLDVGYIWERAL